jgi:hypothetical protein
LITVGWMPYSNGQFWHGSVTANGHYCNLGLKPSSDFYLLF